MSVRRSLSDPDTWDIFVAVKNYGNTPRSVPLGVQFGGAPIGTQRFNLKPGVEENAAFQFKTRAAGWLEARLLTQDAFPQDNRAVLELPARKVLPVTVYSAEPELLRPVFTAISGVQATFQPHFRLRSQSFDGIVLLDHFAPPSPPVYRQHLDGAARGKVAHCGSKHGAKREAASVGARIIRSAPACDQGSGVFECRSVPHGPRRCCGRRIGRRPADRRAAGQAQDRWCSDFIPCAPA